MMTQKSSSSVKLLSKRLEDFFSEICEIGTVWIRVIFGVQVNQNFEHLSREMAQLSDHVTRTQQEVDLGGKGGGQVLKWSYKL